MGAWRRTAALAVVVLLAGCGGDYSDDDAERDVREYASDDLGARLGDCQLVDPGPEAYHVRAFRCELLAAGERFRQYARVYPAPEPELAKTVCFAVNGDGGTGGVGFIGFGFAVPARYPCGQLSG